MTNPLCTDLGVSNVGFFLPNLSKLRVLVKKDGSWPKTHWVLSKSSFNSVFCPSSRLFMLRHFQSWTSSGTVLGVPSVGFFLPNLSKLGLLVKKSGLWPKTDRFLLKSSCYSVFCSSSCLLCTLNSCLQEATLEAPSVVALGAAAVLRRKNSTIIA